MSIFKQKFALEANINKMVKDYGLEKIGFLTLTFRDGIQCARLAAARFDSLNTHYLSRKFQGFRVVTVSRLSVRMARIRVVRWKAGPSRIAV